MKRLILLPLAIILASVLILGACAEEAAPAPAPAPAPSPKPAPSQEPTRITPTVPAPTPTAPAPAPAKVYNLKFNDWGPAGITIGKLHIKAADMIEERTDGNVKITNYFSQSLLKYGDTYRGISSGIADISLYVIGATQGVHVINDVITLPFAGLPNMPDGTKIYTELRQKYPELDEENARTNTMWLDTRMMPGTQLHLVKKSALIPQDLKGMKLISGASLADMLLAVGAAGVILGPPDWYISIERGLVEGHLTHWPAVYDFQLLELFKFHTVFGDGGAGMSPIGFMVNLDSWNELPGEYQKIITEVYTWVNDESVKADLDLIALAEKTAKEWGHIITYLKPEQVEPWAKLVIPYHEKWIAEATAKGWPAQKIYDGMKEIIAKYK